MAVKVTVLYIYIYIYIYMICVCVRLLVRSNPPKYIYIQNYLYIFKHIYTYIHIHGICMRKYIHTYIHTYIIYIHTYIHTFIMVTFDTGTNLPAVSWNSLLAVAMMNIRHRWNEIGVPTQSQPNAASLTLSACNITEGMLEELLAVLYYM